MDEIQLTEKEKKFCDLAIKGLDIKESYKQVFDTKDLTDDIIEQTSLLFSKRKNIQLYLIDNQRQEIEEGIYNRQMSVDNYDKQIKALERLKVEIEEIDDVEAKSKAMNDIIKTIVKIEELKGKLYSLYVLKTENTEIIKLGEGFSKFRERQLKNAIIEGKAEEVKEVVMIDNK